MLRILIILCVSAAAIAEKASVNRQCRELLHCTIKKKCVQLQSIVDNFQGKPISEQLYNDLDSGVDYGCVFTSGCFDECNRCPLCMSSKQQLVDVLSGSELSNKEECHDLVNCATKCVEKSGSDLGMINHCLRHTCAYHCFDGSCPKCSAFITRVFNQICVSGDLRNRVQGFEGQCYEMFRDIVYSKYKQQFDANEKKPAIGRQTN